MPRKSISLTYLAVILGCLLGAPHLGLAQQTPATLRAELTSTILEEFKVWAVAQTTSGWYERQPSGRYQWRNAEPGVKPALNVVLLDRAYSMEHLEKVLSGNVDTARRTLTATYFTPADLAYMSQQLPVARAFRHDQNHIQQPWVRVVSLDTLLALNKRLGKWADMLYADSVVQRIGASRTCSISGMVFTKDGKRALVDVTQNDEYQLCVYRKTSQGWRRQRVLYWIVS